MGSSAALPDDAKRILYLARDREDLEGIPSRLRRLRPPIASHATRRMGEALSVLAREPFDAAVCSVEAPGDVASIILLRKTAPRVPVLALSPDEESPLAKLSLRMGAAAVLKREADRAATAERLQIALLNANLAREVRNNAQEFLNAARELRDLCARARLLAAESAARSAKNPAEGFEPLLVEDEPNEALFFVRALRKAGLPRRLPVVRSASDAINYLQGRGAYADRSLYPAPSIVILDLHLDRSSGEEVIRFIRSEPSLARLPVVLLSATDNPAEIARMLDLGISVHVRKPATMEGLYETVRVILDFWQVWRSQS